jgi:magnesium chelatase family protein
VSGPLLDRFDLRLRVEPTRSEHLMATEPGESSAAVALRVAAARERARSRGVGVNRFLSSDRLDEVTTLDAGARRLLDDAISSGRLSGRGLRRIKVVALTLDDLRGGSGLLDADLVAQALALRADLRFGEPELAA